MAALVALLAEGVDRNQIQKLLEKDARGSPSSRRAWIEIGAEPTSTGHAKVALLAEGVDRNKLIFCWLSSCAGRPPRGGRG